MTERRAGDEPDEEKEKISQRPRFTLSLRQSSLPERETDGCLSLRTPVVVSILLDEDVVIEADVKLSDPRHQSGQRKQH
jgi:hypothetical protein